MKFQKDISSVYKPSTLHGRRENMLGFIEAENTCFLVIVKIIFQVNKNSLMSHKSFGEIKLTPSTSDESVTKKSYEGVNILRFFRILWFV